MSRWSQASVRVNSISIFMFFNLGMNSWMITSGGLTRLAKEGLGGFDGNEMDGSLIVDSIGGVEDGTEITDCGQMERFGGVGNVFLLL